MNLFEKQNKDIQRVRALELDSVIALLPENSSDLKLLEIGAGTGYQLSRLKEFVKEAVGIDIPQSNYAALRTEHVIDYDGISLPFEDNSFDIIFSSNTMEHVVDLPLMHKEIKRVLNPNGTVIHVVPTHIWKIWNTVIHYPMLPNVILSYFQRKSQSQQAGISMGDGTISKRNHNVLSLIKNVIFPPLHGERGNRFTELFYLHTGWWLRHFQENGWKIIQYKPAGVYYSGHFFSSINRQMASKWLGSSCIIIILQSKDSKLKGN
jgi:SAM-dependent methyltransferase